MPQWMVDLGAVWDWIDRRQILRRVMVLGTWGLNGYVILWMLDFAKTTDRGGADIAAIFAAVGMPVAALAGAMFRQYDGHRSTQPPPSQ